MCSGYENLSAVSKDSSILQSVFTDEQMTMPFPVLTFQLFFHLSISGGANAYATAVFLRKLLFCQVFQAFSGLFLLCDSGEKFFIVLFS